MISRGVTQPQRLNNKLRSCRMTGAANSGRYGYQELTSAAE